MSIIGFLIIVAALVGLVMFFASGDGDYGEAIAIVVGLLIVGAIMNRCGIVADDRTQSRWEVGR